MKERSIDRKETKRAHAVNEERSIDCKEKKRAHAVNERAFH
ncbi:hypothetical protein V7157_14125 [Neobacillus drentensis]